MRQLRWQNVAKLLACANEREHWNLLRSWTDPKPRPSLVPLDELVVTFQERMNPSSTPADPDLTDTALQDFTKLRANLIPTHTTDSTPEQSFSRPFILDDVTWAKNRVKTLYLGGAEGLDK